MWLPGLIGSCSCLWLLLSLSGARGSTSIPVSLGNLAAAEVFPAAPGRGSLRSGLGDRQRAGPGDILRCPGPDLAHLDGHRAADPSRSNRTTYAVALAAVLDNRVPAVIQIFGPCRGLWPPGLPPRCSGACPTTGARIPIGRPRPRGRVPSGIVHHLPGAADAVVGFPTRRTSRYRNGP